MIITTIFTHLITAFVLRPAHIMQSPPVSFFAPLPIRKEKLVILSPDQMDAELTKRLKEKTKTDPLYWCLPNRDRRQLAHALFQYPAMMVPEVQRRLIEVICSVNSRMNSLYDPFVGSGTSMVAGMRNGLQCVGQDINPLAILLARVKTQPYQYKALRSKINSVVEIAKNDTSTEIEVNFPGIQKWFRKDVQRDLSRLRRSILNQPDEVRPFLWIILSETIRLTSNDRTSTYKLHARPEEECRTRELYPINTFEVLAKRGCEDLKSFHFNLAKAKMMIRRNTYKGQSTLEIENTQKHAVTPNGYKYDLLVTSPPYGDNTTTVPYGQHSYLALNWIKLDDIDKDIDPNLLKTTQEIDRRSLGGQLQRQQLKSVVHDLSSKSSTLSIVLEQLRDSSVKDSLSRIASFYKDLDECLTNILGVMNPNAYMCWTVANRRVSNIEIPIDKILIELLAGHYVKFVTAIDRTIHHKRMPSRNKTADTMKQERILIFRIL